MASVAPASYPKKYDLIFSDLESPVQVRRHPAARRFTLRVSQTRRAVILTMPKHCSLDDADEFLNENIEWVRTRLAALPDAVPFEDGTIVPLRGESHKLRFVGPLRRRDVVWTEIRESMTMPLLCVTGDLVHPHHTLRNTTSFSRISKALFRSGGIRRPGDSRCVSRKHAGRLF